MKKSLTLLSAFLFLLVGSLVAQPTLPMPSPFSTTTQTIGLTDVTVAYSRPSLKGRKAFGSLVPFNEMWRTGANKATMLKFEGDVKINNTQVPAGSYSMFVIPTKDEWTIVLNTETELWGTGNYDKAKDQLRFKVKAMNNAVTIETFTIEFANLTENSAELHLVWENTRASFTISADAVAAAWANIDSELKALDGSWRTYTRCADYAARTGQRLDDAIAWTEKALELKDDYWWPYSVQAEVYAAKKDYKSAVKSMKKCIKVGSKEANWSYKERMEKRLAELEAM